MLATKTKVVWNLDAALGRIVHWLPTQGPIKDFIHHNTLHAFQEHPFFEGIQIASQVYGARALMPLEWYQQAYREGRITESAFNRVGSHQRDALLRPREERPRPAGISGVGMRAMRKIRDGLDLDYLVHPTLFRLLSSYLDQGVSIWRMPYASGSFWSAVGRIVSESIFPLHPLSDPECRRLLAMPTDEAIAVCLERVVGDPAQYEAYLLELCLAHKGWSGMVAVLENQPGALLAPRPITLKEAIAVELVCELGWIRRSDGAAISEPQNGGYDLHPPVDEESDLLQIWQTALEWSLHESVFVALNRQAEEAHPPSAPPKYQMFFCLDERECSLRRHLEETDPGVETFATAGFFGGDFLYQAAVSAHPFQNCPVILKPRHVVREVAENHRAVPVPRLRDLLHLAPASNTLFRGWLLTQSLGLVALFKLALSVLRPSWRLLADSRLTEIAVPTRLELLRDGDTRTPEGHFLGYSLGEMADRVFGVLRGSGVNRPLSRLVVFVAHGSSSANNPHFAAYNCGACSGKSGAPNARAFALMANNSEVRKRIQAKGFVISDDTFFIGAIHDTTRDEISYFDLDLLPASHRSLFEEFRATTEKALARNAAERCRRFELAPANPTGKQAREHVRDRSRSIFEPRPELNHATNALCIVGRRELTRRLFLDRRAFLNSYDPIADSSGEVLKGILNAVVPVCGGISLEYFFSRVDNEIYGAGTKLPHNVVSLLGVANGVEGDLLTGLPLQMVEVHDPVRLLIVIEQEPAVVMGAIQSNPAVFEWIEKDWVKLGCYSPTQHRSYIFEAGVMRELNDLPRELEIGTFQDSLTLARTSSENIPIHRKEIRS